MFEITLRKRTKQMYKPFALYSWSPFSHWCTCTISMTNSAQNTKAKINVMFEDLSSLSFRIFFIYFFCGGQCIPAHRGNVPWAHQLRWTRAFSPETCLILKHIKMI